MGSEEITDLRGKISAVVEDLSRLCSVANTKSIKLTETLDNGNESLETVGIKLIKLLKDIKGNSSVFINTLYKDLVSINSDEPDTANMLIEMQSLLSKCRSNVIVATGSNSKYTFAKQIDIETMTDIPCETCKLKTLSETKEANTRSTSADNSNTLNIISSNISGLSLKKNLFSETPQTEDELWDDTLQRTSANQESSIKTEKSGSIIKKLSTKNETNFQEISSQNGISQETNFQEISSQNGISQDSEMLLNNTVLGEDDDICIISSNDDDSDSVIELSQNTQPLLKLSEVKNDCEELESYKGKKSSLETQNISDQVQTETVDLDRTTKCENHEISQPTDLQIKDDVNMDNINYNKTELIHNMSEEVEKTPIIEATDVLNDDYLNPYSVKTESLCSDGEEDTEPVHNKTINLHDEHSYSVSSNESDLLIAGSSDSHCVKDSENKISTNQIDSVVEESSNSIDKIDNNAKEKSQPLDFSETYIPIEHNYSSSNSPTNKCENGSDTDETDIDKNVHSNSENVQMNKFANFDLEVPEEQARLSRADSDKSFEFNINNDGNSGLDDDDDDETIIYEITDAINKEPEQTFTSEPTKNVVDDDTITDENEDATNVVPERTSTPEPTNINNENQNSEDSEKVSEDDLMDCTLEEYLSEGETGCHLGSPGMKPDVSKIKLEKDNETNIENNELVIETGDIERKDLGDEILELLKEVPVVTIEDLQSEAHRSIKIESDEMDISSKVDQILKDLDNEIKSDTSSTDDYNSNMDLSDDSDDEMKDQVNNKFDIQKKLQENNMTECHIPLERVEISSNEIRKFKKALNDDIDWLCDLNNLEKKRKNTTPPTFTKRPQKKLKKISSDSSTASSTDSFSDTSSDNENSENGYRSNSPNLDSKSKKRLYEILANAICNDLRSGSSEDSDDSNSDSDKSTKKIKSKSDNDAKSDTGEKRQLSKEELQRKAWRNDPLFRDKLIDSDSATPKLKKPKRYEYDSEFNLDSDHFDTDSDFENLKENNTTKLKENNISPIKENVPDSDSDSDSDVQYISPKKSSPNKEEDEIASPSQKGRKQIRSILSDSDLARETVQAKKEEMERIERIKGRHKIIETLTQSFSSQHSEEDTIPLILDVEEDSGEPLVQVNNIITKKLKPHQREGIKFMWDSCYESIKMIKKEKSGSGCILAHCMGLGKTLQVLTLCHTLFLHKETNTRHVLVVCPLSTVNNWKNETNFAFKGLKKDEQFSVFYINNRGKQFDKYRIVESWHLRKKSMLVLGYECFESLTNHAKLDKLSSSLKQRILEYLVDPGPDLVVCDEGHLIKNHKTLRTMALHKIKTRRRIVMTGTPLQNNLVEYYEMVNFVKPNLLGNIWEFKRNFVNPISNGQYEDSNALDIKLMMKMTHVLHKLLVKTVQRVEDTELEIYLPPMVDHAVFIQLNQIQVDLYSLFSKKVQTRSNYKKYKRKQFLGDFHTFQHIGTHPHLLVLIDKNRNNKIKEKDVITNEEDHSVISEEGWWKDKMPADSLEKIEYGNKLVVLKAIIEECEAVNDKLLVFSQSLCEMDLIEHFLKNAGTERCSSWKKKVDYFRMDGTVSPEERSTICDMFNDEKRKRVRLLLMSTKVGGLGLNLTAANRVVIMTVHWNPSYDTQSIFRVYRFGQKKQVYVYRLIALDTMESKVYQRQVTKLAIAHRVIDKHHITRHYKSMDLQEMYSCVPNADDERPTPNVPEDEMLAKVILKLSCIFKYHEHKALLADKPEDKLSEQEMAAAWEDFKNNKDTLRNPNTPPLPQPQQHYMPQESYHLRPSFNKAYNLEHTNSASRLYYMPPPNTGTSSIPQFKQITNPSTMVEQIQSNHARLVCLSSNNQQGLSKSNANVNSSIHPYIHSNQGKIISAAESNPQGPSMSNGNVNSSNHSLKTPQSNKGSIISLVPPNPKIPSASNVNVNSSSHLYKTPQPNQVRNNFLASSYPQVPSTSNVNTNLSDLPYKAPQSNQGRIISPTSNNPPTRSTNNVNVNSNKPRWPKKIVMVPQNINHASKENAIKIPRVVLANTTKIVSQQTSIHPTNTFSKPVNLVQNPFNRNLASSSDVVVSKNPLIIKLGEPMSSVSGNNSLKRISLKENSMPPSRSTLNSTDGKRIFTTEDFNTLKHQMLKNRTEINLIDDEDNNENANGEVIQIL